MKLNKGERQVVNFSGDVPGGKQGNFTVTVTRTGGRQVFRQSFAYTVSGWTPQRPVKPANAPPVEELPLTRAVRPGDEHGPGEGRHPRSARPRKSGLRRGEGHRSADRQGARKRAHAPFSEWYGGAELRLKDVAIPVQDFRKAG